MASGENNMQTDKTFSYAKFNVSNILPDNWQNTIIKLCNRYSQNGELAANSVTSKEFDSRTILDIKYIPGEVILKKLRWLFNLYRNEFYSLASKYSSETIYCANDIRHALNFNIQVGNEMRYECHVDSNPISCILNCTSHPMGDGGELIVSNDINSIGIDEIESDCQIIIPESGNFLIFDGRYHPHYVRPLIRSEGLRIILGMNYYTDECPESFRPSDLDCHLGY